MIKVVFDTNLIISGLNFPAGKPAKVLNLAVFGLIKNCTSKYILNETTEILQKKFYWKKAECDSAKLLLELISKTVRPKQSLRVISHRADNRILECVLAGRAKYIITGDKHLLDIKNFRGTKIVTPQAFWEII